jgi:hypothetical protein
MVVQVASFLPFQTTYYLNGHSFLEQELKRGGSASASTTAFLAVADVGALQAAADRLSPGDHPPAPRLPDPGPRTEVLKEERAKLNLSCFYAISQFEYCRATSSSGAPGRLSRSQEIDDALDGGVGGVVGGFEPAVWTAFAGPAGDGAAVGEGRTSACGRRGRVGE